MPGEVDSLSMERVRELISKKATFEEGVRVLTRAVESEVAAGEGIKRKEVGYSPLRHCDHVHDSSTVLQCDTVIMSTVSQCHQTQGYFGVSTAGTARKEVGLLMSVTRGSKATNGHGDKGTLWRRDTVTKDTATKDTATKGQCEEGTL